jgi:hypothetical protein
LQIKLTFGAGKLGKSRDGLDIGSFNDATIERNNRPPSVIENRPPKCRSRAVISQHYHPKAAISRSDQNVAGESRLNTLRDIPAIDRQAGAKPALALAR